MKLKRLCFFLFATSILNIHIAGQSLDEDFLNSLSEEARTQLLKEIDSEENLANTKNLRAPSSAINIEKTSDKFGVDYFRTLQTTFMPINEPIFDPNYILGYGDELLVQFTGQKNDILNIRVNREGSINLPEVGRIMVAGLSLSRVDQLLQAEIKKAFIGVDIFITLESIRDMQILVVGEAAFPGVYTLPGNASLLNVLSAAGGVTDDASFRSIEIKREGKVLRTLDLYQAFIYGDFSKINEPLNSGDTIFIKPADFEVRIQGGVTRSGIYELLRGEGYKELLAFANGYQNIARTNEIQLSRVEDQTINYLIYNDEDLQSIPLRHKDVISVQSIDTVTVTISGAVERPGSYILPERSAILDLINIAGGYKEEAYPFGGIYLSESAAEQEKKSKELIRQDLLSFASTSPLAEDKKLDAQLVLQEYESFEPAGRISINFDLANLRSEAFSLALLDGDEVIIPSFQNIVHVYGDVENPGSFEFKTLKDVEYYLGLAGSLKDTASKKIILYHANGESNIVTKSGFLGSSKNGLVYPGTLIFVPREFKLSGVDASRVYLPIVSNLALTMASIASLSNN